MTVTVALGGSDKYSSLLGIQQLELTPAFLAILGLCFVLLDFVDGALARRLNQAGCYWRGGIGQDGTGQDGTGQDRTGQDGTGQDRTRQDGTG